VVVIILYIQDVYREADDEVWYADAKSETLVEGQDHVEVETPGKEGHHPRYGRKGAGWVKNPRKAAYNKVCRKTRSSFWDLFK
jgi:hypothetical protein